MGELIRKNHLIWTVSLFLFMFAFFLYLKPSIAFGPDGSIKPFGVQKRGSTVFPVWWWTILFAALSRIGISYASGYSV
jgi:quinol-cytochrome oxidoreductase complex cytochrome b subunit